MESTQNTTVRPKTHLSPSPHPTYSSTLQPRSPQATSPSFAPLSHSDLRQTPRPSPPTVPPSTGGSRDVEGRSLPKAFWGCSKACGQWGGGTKPGLGDAASSQLWVHLKGVHMGGGGGHLRRWVHVGGGAGHLRGGSPQGEFTSGGVTSREVTSEWITSGGNHLRGGHLRGGGGHLTQSTPATPPAATPAYPRAPRLRPWRAGGMRAPGSR